MNFQRSEFPSLTPSWANSGWSRLGRGGDPETELRELEAQQLAGLQRLRLLGSDAAPLGRSAADGADDDDEPEEDEYDDDDNDDDDEEDSEMAEDLDPPLDQRF